MPASITVTQYMSLDGVIEDPVGMDGSDLGDWTGPYSRGPRGDELKTRELFDADALLLGRRTYDAFAAVWPSVEDGSGFAARINAMPKYVVSNSLGAGNWNNSRILAGDPAETVAALRAGSDERLLVYGSAALIEAIAPRGLVDRYHLMVYPTILGRGRRLFPAGGAAALALEEGIELGSGIMFLRYRAA